MYKGDGRSRARYRTTMTWHDDRPARSAVDVVVDRVGDQVRADQVELAEPHLVARLGIAGSGRGGGRPCGRVSGWDHPGRCEHRDRECPREKTDPALHVDTCRLARPGKPDRLNATRGLCNSDYPGPTRPTIKKFSSNIGAAPIRGSLGKTARSSHRTHPEDVS